MSGPPHPTYFWKFAKYLDRLRGSLQGHEESKVVSKKLQFSASLYKVGDVQEEARDEDRHLRGFSIHLSCQ